MLQIWSDYYRQYQKNRIDMRVKRYRIKIATILAMLTLSVGCGELGLGIEDRPGPPLPDPIAPGDDNGNGLPKRPIPIKPKKNPGGKIERPKAIDDILDRIF